MNKDMRIKVTPGAKFWYLNNTYHREDGPAVLWNDGSEEWWQHGEKHRTDEPAMFDPNRGDAQWWVNGQLHRVGGPASIQFKANKNRGVAGEPEWVEASSSWFYQDARHRIDGPARICRDGSHEWWLFGNKSSETEVTNFHSLATKLLDNTLITEVPYEVLKEIFLTNQYSGMS